MPHSVTKLYLYFAKLLHAPCPVEVSFLLMVTCMYN